MNRLSVKHIIVIVVVLTLIVSTLTITLSLTMCDYEEPDLSKVEVISPYGNYDISKKPYYSLQMNHGVKIYKGNAYFLNQFTEIQYVSLNDLQRNMKEYVRTEPGDQNENLAQYAEFVCPVTDHKHGTLDGSTGCPGWIGEPCMMFLLDSYESNGSFPIIYYAQLTDLSVMGDNTNKYAWDIPSTYTIYRYDTGSNRREKMAETDNPPIRMMAYGDRVYVITQSAHSEYQLNLLDKKSKQWTELTIGEGALDLISADDDFVYVSDLKGNLFKITNDLSANELIYTLDEVLIVNAGDDSLGMFIDGDYLYFRSNYQTSTYQVEYEASPYEINVTLYDLSRRPLSDLSSESELVAEKIIKNGELGIAGGKFYYSPCEFAKTDFTGSFYYNFTNGTVRCVDLNTLEATDVVSEGGFMLDNRCDPIIGVDYAITYVRPVSDKGYDWTRDDGARYFSLYEFSTGNLYAIVS